MTRELCGIAVAHHLQTVEIDIIQTAIRETAQHNVVKTVRRADLVAVHTRRVTHRPGER